VKLFSRQLKPDSCQTHQHETERIQAGPRYVEPTRILRWRRVIIRTLSNGYFWLCSMSAMGPVCVKAAVVSVVCEETLLEERKLRLVCSLFNEGFSVTEDRMINE
jgi:hypothetical protein